jgi:two-component system, OmpR family, sensor histidine kinase KdpD
MDLDAMLARAPQVALVDELAHSNVPGARNAKQWEDVEDLLAAGIDVISTVSIEHLDSLADVVEKITGLAPRQTVPDPVVRAAGEVDLVDLTPEALRDRMVRGNIYPPSEAQAALARWFRICNLTAMRELALLWLATMLASDPRRHWPGGCDPGSGHAPGRVVGLGGGPQGEPLIRRAPRIAAGAHHHGRPAALWPAPRSGRGWSAAAAESACISSPAHPPSMALRPQRVHPTRGEEPWARTHDGPAVPCCRGRPQVN